LLYLIARRAGVAALKRVTPKKRDRIENLLGRFDLIAVMVPAVLPPPFPFKPFVLCAGVLKLKTWRFVTAIFVGRAVRFVLEGWLAIRFGEDANQIVKQQGWKVLIGVAAVAAIVLLVALVRARLRSSHPLGAEALSAESGGNEHKSP
jgi:membrane protein DedA with SNARE-associated domain